MLLKLGLETIYFTWNPGIIADNLHNEKREQLIFLGHLRVNMDKYVKHCSCLFYVGSSENSAA